MTPTRYEVASEVVIAVAVVAVSGDARMKLHSKKKVYEAASNWQWWETVKARTVEVEVEVGEEKVTATGYELKAEKQDVGKGSRWEWRWREG